MKRLLLALMVLTALLVATGCPISPGPVNPGGSGGVVSVGGNLATGGETPVAGAAGLAGGASTGGALATGGQAATGGKAPACPAYSEPTCAASGTVLTKERKAELTKQLTGWRPSPDHAKTRRWRPTYQMLPSICSRLWSPNNKLPFGQRRGSCTANATGGILSTQPFAGRLTQDDVDERIYPRATLIDPFPGQWPPTDTGSNGASAWQAAIDLGYTTIPSTPIASLEELQSAMQKVSCMVGVDWHNNMFSPTKCGELTMGGGIAGGHEVHIIGINLDTKKVWIRNSWWDPDNVWGLSHGDEIGGYAYFSFGTLQKLLQAGGEIDCPASPPLISQRLGFGPAAANDNAVQYREAG